MKVFVGLTEIAGYSSGVAKGLVENGHEVCSVVVDPHPFGYAAGGQLRPPLLLRAARRVRRRSSSRIARVVAKALVALSFPIVVARFDVVVLLFGGRFVSVHEGRVARLFGCRVVHVFLGSDARPASIDAVIVDPAVAATRTKAAALERRARRRVRGIERAADVVVALPAYAHFLERRFVSFHWIGLPIEAQPARRAADDGRPLRVLHAPSHPRGKGTALIREAVALVQEAGMAVDYVELQSVTNAQVKEALRSADVLLDQAFSDTPLAALACEATASGVVAVVGTLHDHPLWTAPGPTSIVVAPDLLAQVLFDLCADPGATRAIGESGREAIASMWSPSKVAARLIASLEGDGIRLTGSCCDQGFGNHQGATVTLARPNPAAQRSPGAWSEIVSGRTEAGTPTTRE